MVDDVQSGTKPLSDELSQGAYARSRGWSPQYVSKLVKQGKIELTANGKIDAVRANAMLERLADGNRVAVRMANAQRRASPSGAVPAAGRGYVENPLSKATVSDKTAAAMLKQLEIDERTRKSCLVETVVRAVIDTQAATAQMLDQMIERTFMIVAAETDPLKVRALLQAEVREVRHAIAAFVESLPERVTDTRQ